jgi:hypothetical protein
MLMRGTRVLLVVTLAGASIACEESRCRTPQAQAVDEGRSCVKPAMEIPELRACSPYPPTRGIRVFCLVDRNGLLYLAGGGDSETLSGDGWRYSGGTGTNALSATENARCTDAIAAVGSLEPSKLCAP